MRLPRLLRNPWLAQLLVAAALVALAVWQSDTHQIAESLRNVRPEWLLVALLIYVALRFEHALESLIVLTKVGRPPIFGIYGVLLVGSLINGVLPANLGDVAKLQIFANKYGLPRVALVASRGAEAVVNGVMFVVFVVISVVLASGQGGGQGLQYLLAGVSSSFCAVLIVAAIVMPEALPRWRWLERLPNRLERWLDMQWPRIHEGFEAVRQPRLLITLLVLNVVGWTVEITMYWAYGHAFNLDVPFGAYVSIAVIVALVTTFPITFGNVGSWEVGVIAALSVYGVPRDAALAFAVGIHVFVTLFNIGLGLVAMIALGLKPRDVFAVRATSN